MSFQCPFRTTATVVLRELSVIHKLSISFRIVRHLAIEQEIEVGNQWRGTWA
jgi:hypothetical protein